MVADRLWLPDFALYDNADGDFIVSESVRARVFHNGTIQWTTGWKKLLKVTWGEPMGEKFKVKFQSKFSDRQLSQKPSVKFGLVTFLSIFKIALSKSALGLMMVLML